MSEHQYYDFRSIDQALTVEQKKQFHNLSSKANVGSHHAQFVYNYGGFNDNVKTLMANNFDIMLYTAKQKTQRLMFRIPEHLISITILKNYFIPEKIEYYRGNNDNIILDLSLNFTDNGKNNEGRLDDFLPLREELMLGDYRVLYLAWIKAAENILGYNLDILNKDTKEPSVPSGLNNLSVAQKNYAQWIDLNKYFIKVAAETSTFSPASFQPEEYLHYLSTEEKQDVLQRLCRNEEDLSATLRRKLEKEHKNVLKKTNKKAGGPRRTFFDLYEHYQELRVVEEEKEAAQKKKEEDLQHQARLNLLRGNEETLWRSIYTLVEQRNDNSYELAAADLFRLYDLAVFDKTLEDFIERTTVLVAKYSRRSTFLSRIKTITDL